MFITRKVSKILRCMRISKTASIIKGRFSYRKFRLRGKENELIIQQFKDGKYITPYQNMKIQFHGLPFKIGIIEIDNEKVNYESVQYNGDNSIVVSKDFTEIHLIGV